MVITLPFFVLALLFVFAPDAYAPEVFRTVAWLCHATFWLIVSYLIVNRLFPNAARS